MHSMIVGLIIPSKKYNLLIQTVAVILQPKAISGETRNKSPPLAEAIKRSLSRWQNKSGSARGIVCGGPGSGKVFEFRFFFKEY